MTYPKDPLLTAAILGPVAKNNPLSQSNVNLEHIDQSPFSIMQPSQTSICIEIYWPFLLSYSNTLTGEGDLIIVLYSLKSVHIPKQVLDM